MLVRQNIQERKLSEEEVKCLQSLYRSNYKHHRSRNPEHVDGTCEWFTRHSRYISWRRNADSDLLWLTADAGCGKSVLSSFIIDRVAYDIRSVEDTTICYFFFKDDAEEQRSSSVAFSSILHQIITANIKSLSHAMEEFQNKGAAVSKEFNTLWNILLKTCEDADGRNIICILDGLDECDEDERFELVRALEQWYTHRQPRSPEMPWSLKILVTSRPTVRVSDHFFEIPSIRLRAEDEALSIAADIELVVRSKIMKIARRRSLSTEVQQEVIGYILKNADRTFLWASIVLQRVERSERFSRKALKELLESTPPDLYGIFEKILSESSNSKFTRKILEMIVGAFRPMTLDEMNLAFVIDPEDKCVADLSSSLEPDMESTVKLLCGVFIRITESTVYLVHQTAREFLLPEKNLARFTARPPESYDSSYIGWKHSFQPMDTHRMMAKICSWYILLRDFGDFPLRVLPDTGDAHLSTKVNKYAANHPLLKYASYYWADHFQQANYSMTDYELTFFLNLYQTTSNNFKTWFQIYWNIKYTYSLGPEKVTPLIVAAHFGHVEIIRRLAKKSLAAKSRSSFLRFVDKVYSTIDEINARDDDDWTALTHAASYGHLNVVSLLLEQRFIDVNCKDSLHRTPLIRASKEGHLEIVKILLLRRDIQPDIYDDRGYTALYYAAGEGYTEIVRLLLDRKDVDINFSNQYGHTSFSAAVSSGSMETVKLFLNRPDLLEKPELPSAAGSGNLELFNLLLSRSEPNFSSIEAFNRAASCGQLEMVRILLKREPSLLNKQDSSGRTALHSAFIHPPVIEFLLHQPGINPNVVDKYGESILLTPFRQFMCDQEMIYKTVKLLIQHPATDINLGTDNGAKFLSNAAHYDCPGGLKAILEHNVSLNLNQRDSGGFTALCTAASSRKTKLVELLVVRPEVDVNMPNYSGMTPLIWAAKSGFKEIVHILLAREDLILEAKDNEGKSAMIYAHENGYQEIVGAFLLMQSLRAGIDLSSLTSAQLALLGLTD